jgi:CRP-like cAMP-binding protein
MTDNAMKRKLEVLILGTCALIALGLAMTRSYLPEDWLKLDYLISLSSLLTVASFSVRAMLPLRALAVASQLFAIPYFMLQPTPLWTPVGWTALFMAINLYHITRILLERRPVKFTPDEQKLYDLAFKSFEPRDFLKLLKMGDWRNARQGDKILFRGQPIEQILVPISGAVAASQDEKVVAQLHPGELIGAGIALTGQASPFNADFAEDARYMAWRVTDVNRFMDKNPDLAIKFNDVINRYLVAQINKLALYLDSNHR